MRTSCPAVSRIVSGLIERIRADVIDEYSRQYWPMDLVAPFVINNWWRWYANPPDWFDHGFRKRVPRELIPTQGRAVSVTLAPRHSSSFLAPAQADRPDARTKDERSVDDLTETLLKMLARTAAQVRPLLSTWRAHRLGRTAGDNFYERIMPLALSKLVQMLQSLRARRGGVISRAPVLLLILEQGGDWCLCVVLWRFERALL